MENKEPNRYTKILEAIFARHFKKGSNEIEFERTEFSQVADELGIFADGSQVETDEIYIALDKRGAHYVLPVQAKGVKEKIGIVQIEQDIELCAQKFPHLICRAIAAKLMEDNLIALFEFEQTNEGIKVSSEKQYRLVEPNELSSEELRSYSTRQT